MLELYLFLIEPVKITQHFLIYQTEVIVQCPSPHGRTFPTALDPHFCNRYEIGKFAKDAYELGINYLGVCCGANPMLIREVAESIGLTVPASKYRENMENHFMYGKNKRIPKHMTEYGDKA